VDVLVELLAFEGDTSLAEEGDNGSSRVSTNDSDGLIGGVGVLNLGNEAGGANNI